jgi:hypothetical protein
MAAAAWDDGGGGGAGGHGAPTPPRRAPSAGPSCCCSSGAPCSCLAALLDPNRPADQPLLCECDCVACCCSEAAAAGAAAAARSFTPNPLPPRAASASPPPRAPSPATTPGRARRPRPHAGSGSLDAADLETPLLSAALSWDEEEGGAAGGGSLSLSPPLPAKPPAAAEGEGGRAGESMELTVGGMSCASCARSIEAVVTQVAGPGWRPGPASSGRGQRPVKPGSSLVARVLWEHLGAAATLLRGARGLELLPLTRHLHRAMRCVQLMRPMCRMRPIRHARRRPRACAAAVVCQA